MMPRRFAPMQSDKHEVTWSNLSQDAGTAPINVTLSTAVATADKNTSVEVGIGSKISSIYFEFHFSTASTGNVNVVHWEIFAFPEGLTEPPPNLYYQKNRSYIMKRGMEMLPVNVSTVFKRIFVVKIPKIYQRQKDGMKIRLKYQASSTEAINACGIAIYKEIY